MYYVLPLLHTALTQQLINKIYKLDPYFIAAQLTVNIVLYVHKSAIRLFYYPLSILLPKKKICSNGLPNEKETFVLISKTNGFTLNVYLIYS